MWTVFQAGGRRGLSKGLGDDRLKGLGGLTEVSAAWAAPGAPPPAPTPVATAASGVPGAGSPAGGAAGGGSLTGPDGVRGLEGVRPIPLRPLTVLELLDGSIGAVRALGSGVIARVSVVTGSCALTGLGVLWAFYAAMRAAVRVHPNVTTDDFGLTTVHYGEAGGAAKFGIFLVSALIPVVFSGFAATVAAGLIARPVKEYIDGNSGAALTSAARGNGASAHGKAGNIPTAHGAVGVSRAGAMTLARLCILATVVALPRILFTGLLMLVAFSAANDPQGAYAGSYVLLILGGAAVCFWLTAETAVCAPAGVLEGLGPAAALGRSRRLASSGRWRTLWTSLLTLAICSGTTLSLIVLQYSVFYGHHISDLLDGAAVDSSTYWWLAADVVLAALTSLLTVPFRAAVAAMLYVDRRFRREGLDIRIAWARVARATGGGKGR